MENLKPKYEYPNLFFISQISKGIGIIILIIAIVGFIYGSNMISKSSDEKVIGIYLTILSIICGLILPILFFAIAELIKLFIRIEFNTRNSFIDNSNKKVDYPGFQPPGQTLKEFDEWKIEKPTKSLNDYYAALMKNNK